MVILWQHHAVHLHFHLFRTTTVVRWWFIAIILNIKAIIRSDVSEHLATVGRNNILLNKKTTEDHLQQTWQNTNHRKDETDVNDMYCSIAYKHMGNEKKKASTKILRPMARLVSQSRPCAQFLNVVTGLMGLIIDGFQLIRRAWEFMKEPSW